MDAVEDAVIALRQKIIETMYKLDEKHRKTLASLLTYEKLKPFLKPLLYLFAYVFSISKIKKKIKKYKKNTHTHMCKDTHIRCK